MPEGCYRYLNDQQKADLDSFPPMTAEDLEKINDLFPHYIFYSRQKDGSRQVDTSCCGREGLSYGGLKTLITPDDHFFMALRHNEEITCPFCGRKVMVKDRGKCRSYKNLHAYKAVVVLHAKASSLYADAAWIHKDYAESIKPLIYPVVAYHFMPGWAAEFRNEFGCWEYHEERDAIHPRRRQVGEPFKLGLIELINAEALGCEVSKYSQCDTYCGHGHHGLMKYLAMYCIYPRQVEMLMKTGQRRYIADFLEGCKKNAAAIDWTATNPKDAFGLDGSELRAYMASSKLPSVLAIYKRLRRHGYSITFSEIEEYERQLIDTVLRKFCAICIKHKLTPQQLWAYLQPYAGPRCGGMGYRSMQTVVSDYVDYLRMAARLGYNLKDGAVLLPESLEAAHLEAAEAEIKLIERERNMTREMHRRQALERERESKERARELREQEKEAARLRSIGLKGIVEKYQQRYGYQDDYYLIRAARSEAEIVAEGKALHHCVGGYAKRYGEGKLVILFLRDKANTEKPLATIEMNGKRLVQVRGFANDAHQPPARTTYASILDPWLDWVAAGSKRDKDGSPIYVGDGIYWIDDAYLHPLDESSAQAIITARRDGDGRTCFFVKIGLYDRALIYPETGNRIKMLPDVLRELSTRCALMKAREEISEEVDA